jgi:hypothetical protein
MLNHFISLTNCNVPFESYNLKLFRAKQQYSNDITIVKNLIMVSLEIQKKFS